MAGMGPEQAKLKLTADEEAQIMKMNSTAEITEYLHSLEVDRGYVKRDYYSPDVLIPVPEAEQQQRQTAQPSGKMHAKTIVYNGKEETITADDEAGLNAAELAFFRQKEQARNDDGTFRGKTAEEIAAEQSAVDAHTVEMIELDHKFRMGLLSPREYMEQSGLLKDMVSQVIDQRVENEQEAKRVTANVQGVVAEFLEHSDWPGGKENERTMQEILEANDITDPDLGDLNQAYQLMKDKGLVARNPEQDALVGLANAKTKEELDRHLDFFRPSGGGYFQR